MSACPRCGVEMTISNTCESMECMRGDLDAAGDSLASPQVPAPLTAGHTPLPWRIDPSFPADIIGGDGRDVAETTLSADYRRPIPEQKANAAFIVRACNSHDDLLAALMRLVEHPACQASYSEDSEMARRVDRAVTAILKAGVTLPDEWPESVSAALSKASPRS